LYATAVGFWEGLRLKQWDIQKFVKQFHNAPITPQQEEKMGALLDEAIVLAHTYQFTFIVCIHPHLTMAEHINNSIFAKLVEQRNIPYFHMLMSYRKYGATLDTIRLEEYPRDLCHPNVKGHAFIAQAIYEELSRLGLLTDRYSLARREK
jgi:heat shock protein HspQ